MKREKDITWKILKTIDEINSINDLDLLLERVLFETRRFTSADAGTIYLVEEGRLKFSYVQNDTLSREGEKSLPLVIDREIEVDRSSIAGFVASTGEPLIIDDVYRIPSNLPYNFNPSFDEKTGYRTVSMLTVPLHTTGGTLVGVLQIINKLDKEGRVIPFTREDQLYITIFATSAAVAIERARLTRDNILRMIKMVEMRDPTETGPHVNRVGAYSVEIYQRWAERRGVPGTRMRRFKDNLRIASMLHDVGKIGISDTILQKRKPLTQEEFNTIKLHTVFGARLFKNRDSELDNMAAEICLNHHERWDGNGYPGHIPDIFSPNIEFGPGKKGEEIPLSARIVSIADVYDALISRRVYKEPWQEEKVLKYIKEESGKYFDPELVEVFFSIYDVIKMIKERFKE